MPDSTHVSLKEAQEQAKELSARWEPKKSEGLTGLPVNLREAALNKIYNAKPTEIDFDSLDELARLDAAWYYCTKKNVVTTLNRTPAIIYREKLDSLLKSGRDTFVAYIIYLRYYHSKRCDDFLNQAFGKGEWVLDEMQEVEKWPERAAVKPIDFPANIIRIIRRRIAAKESFEDRVKIQSSQLVEHKLENKFFELLKDKNSGFWALSAGPGMGKTGMMERIAYVAREENICIPYFFEWSSATAATASISEYRKYLTVNLIVELDLLNIKKFSNLLHDIDNPDILEELFFLLEDSPEIISENRKVVIVVDALDEVGEGFSYDEPSLLPLPQKLPDGIYVAYSVRHTNDEGAKIWQAPILHNPVELSEKSPEHIETAKRYVQRSIQSLRFLSEFLNRLRQAEPVIIGCDYDRACEWFIEKICSQTGGNFLILKYILHDETMWEGNKLILHQVPKELFSFYENYFQRMTENKRQKLNVRAAYCFALQEQISKFSLLRLLDGDRRNQTIFDAEELVEQWCAQGLIKLEKEGSDTFYKPYHSSFRKFLFEKLRSEDQVDFFDGALDNLMSGEKYDGRFEFLDGRSAHIHKEWIILLLSMLTRLRKTSLLAVLLGNLSFWQLGRTSGLGIWLILGRLKNIKLGDDLSEDRKRVLIEEYITIASSVIDSMKEWTRDGLLISPQNNTYAFVKIIKFASKQYDPKVWGLREDSLNFSGLICEIERGNINV